MKALNKILIVIIILLITSDIEILNSEEVVSAGPIVTHAQDVWINALEWCESRGNPKNINPKDKDNTPSYYSYQFKPGTFRYYGEKYKVIETKQTDAKVKELMKSQTLQRTIVENMLTDKKVKWDHEFPDCVKNKIGYPPTY